MRAPDSVVTAALGPLMVWAFTSASIFQSIGLCGLMLIPAGLVEGWRLYKARKARTVPGPDLSARITIPLDVLSCARAPTVHEQVELIRRLREAQDKIFQLTRSE